MQLRNQAQQMSADMALISGIEKSSPNTTFTVLSQPQTSAQVVAVLQARVDKAQAVLDARAAFHTAVLAYRTEVAQSATYVSGVRQGIVAQYANSPATLADFGLSARKAPAPLTAAEKTVAVQKRKATREARHTMGSVQKAKIVGVLSGPVVVGTDGTVSTSSVSSAAATASPPATPAVTNGVSTTSH